MSLGEQVVHLPTRGCHLILLICFEMMNDLSNEVGVALKGTGNKKKLMNCNKILSWVIE